LAQDDLSVATSEHCKNSNYKKILYISFKLEELSIYFCLIGQIELIVAKRQARYRFIQDEQTCYYYVLSNIIVSNY